MYFEKINKINKIRLISAIVGIALSSIILYYFSSSLFSHSPCCDYGQYYALGRQIEAKGFLGFFHTYSTYLFPLYISLLPVDLDTNYNVFLSSFAYIQSFVFLVLSCSILFLIRDSKYFFPFLLGICINPIILSYIPLPLTEFLTCLIIMVLIVLMANIDKIKPLLLIIIAGSIGGLLIALRPAHILVGVGLIFFVSYMSGININTANNKVILHINLCLRS